MSSFGFFSVLFRASCWLGICLAGSTSARATERVTNTARVSWTTPGGIRSQDSNTLTLQVKQDASATITTYTPDSASPIGATITDSVCWGSATGSARAGGSGREAVTQTRSVTAGDDLIFSLTYPRGNIDPAKADVMIAVLTTRSGDKETLTVYETGASTGVFIGRIATTVVPPAARHDDCVMSVLPDSQDAVTITYQHPSDEADVATTTVEVLADPYGRVFDSDDGGFVSGARVSLVDAATGQPARVFAPDGKTPWPSSVVTGQPVSDGAGTTYPGKPGRFWFPLAPQGNYRLVIEPPASYKAPSTATPAEIGQLTRPNGRPFAITDASYGRPFALLGTSALRVDIPIDGPSTPVELTKTASRSMAARGDVVFYTVTVRNPDANRIRRELTIVDALPPEMRLRPASIRVNGTAQAFTISVAPDGRSLTVQLRRIPAASVRTITYALDVRPDAKPGQAMNRVSATDSKGRAVTASVAVRVTGETIASRMTIIGRVLDAACTPTPPFVRGVPGIRVMLEDGSYSVTDRDGRYHFEGVVPGTHVVQVDEGSSPAWRFVDCTRSTRSVGSAISRFVEGQGGMLAIADFHAVRRAGQPTVAAAPDAPATAGDRTAAGAERDWFANGIASVAWLFPEADHNPRSPALRVAIQHLAGQSVRLFANGKPVDAITLDGTRMAPTKTFGVTLWRGVPLIDGQTDFTAEVLGEDGKVVTTLKRSVWFTNAAARAEYLPAQSRLVADGVHRPVIAVRITDRNGRPVRHGVTGQVSVPAPYEAAVAIDAEQARILSGVERAGPTWRVDGDDGVALIELAPTTTSGALGLDFLFRDRDQVRRQKLDTWLAPGDRPWTIVGLAEGRLGTHSLGDKVEPLRDAGSDLDADGRLALYAKGRVLGRWLLTFAYDSDKQRDWQRLGGTIDPNTYYTVYADRTERRFDAASTRKLYLRLEREQFYALFGDFLTGFNDTELGRYNRAGTGVKAEARVGQVTGSAFAARFGTLHRRDEIQGNGLTGPYQLSARGVFANSERVVIEVRDRLRSERIVERRELSRFVDYDVDYATGVIRFAAPVLSRSSALDPQFIVADYDLYEEASGEISAGARGAWMSKDGRVRAGATGLTDADGNANGRTHVGAADLRVRLGDKVEVRAEAALSVNGGKTNGAYLVEAEIHDGRIDALAYVRQQDAQFGVAQQNAAERGRRKVGLDGRVLITDALSVMGSVWTDDDLTGAAQRRAIRARVEYRANGTDLRVGLVHAADRLEADRRNSSTLVEAGATRAFLDNKLDLDLATSFAIGQADSVDFPARHRLGARYQVTPNVALVGSYEIASGDKVDARTARIGFDLRPWAGARLTTGLGRQDMQEYGRRAFAAYGLAQSLPLSARWSIDATLDGNRTLGGIDAGDVVSPRQPVASGGFVGDGSLITEDFTAVALGGTYRADLWSATARAERRWSDRENRMGATLGVIRQLGDGQVLGALASWSRARTALGTETRTGDIAVSGASRPSASQVAVFGKVDYRQDEVLGAVAGQPVLGLPLAVTGDALSRRLVGSLSLDWVPYGRDEEGLFQRHEIGLFLGSRYVFDRIDGFDLDGLTTMIGVDARIGLGERFEIGLTATVRGQLARGNFAYAVGPSLGVRLARNMLINGGWNLLGFDDRDFAAARTIRQGPYVSARLKFDQHSLSFLGLGK